MVRRSNGRDPKKEAFWRDAIRQRQKTGRSVGSLVVQWAICRDWQPCGSGCWQMSSGGFVVCGAAGGAGQDAGPGASASSLVRRVPRASGLEFRRVKEYRQIP